ncbi:hypothetical protein MUK42_03129 [Musa troglodytarum]|uniref:Uncharacterized protein n=1 Tax=Musa troglodytarum TaxID=320322 RepID=A0A9E7EH74_9LILI|nr:hypothetical protein MUK42_03129 [Musa troglodytarum]
MVMTTTMRHNLHMRGILIYSFHVLPVTSSLRKKKRRRRASRTAPEGTQRLGTARSQDVLVVGRSYGSTNGRPHPEDPLQPRKQAHQEHLFDLLKQLSTITPNRKRNIDHWRWHLVIPGLVLVVDDGGSEAPRRVDARARDRDRRQVDHENRESNREGSQNLQNYIALRITDRDVGVPSTALGVGSGEDGVDEDEGADDLGAEAGALGVALAELVGAAAVADVVGLLERLDEADATDRPQALRHHVEEGAHQRHLSRQEQPERHRRVDVPTCRASPPPTPLANVEHEGKEQEETGDAGGAVDEDEDHATEGPGDAEDADAAAGRVGRVHVGVRLVLVPDHRQHGDVQEQHGGDELRDRRPVQRPLGQLLHVDERRRWRVGVVLGAVLPLLRPLDVLRHLQRTSTRCTTTSVVCASREGYLKLFKAFGDDEQQQIRSSSRFTSPHYCMRGRRESQPIPHMVHHSACESDRTVASICTS